MLNIILLNAVMLNVVMLSVIMLNVVMLSVIMLNVVMLNVVAPTMQLTARSPHKKCLGASTEKVNIIDEKQGMLAEGEGSVQLASSLRFLIL